MSKAERKLESQVEHAHARAERKKDDDAIQKLKEKQRDVGRKSAKGEAYQEEILKHQLHKAQLPVRKASHKKDD